ncbi:hypothetical protein BDQ17DRAFT_1339370 [Cyathus striatus]|nr:hypothetical protein BDQ17DRAFT_1339370 [Cyathus striatus]
MHFSAFVVAALAVPCLSATVSSSAQTVQQDFDSLSSKAAAFNEFVRQALWSNGGQDSNVQFINEHLNKLTNALHKGSDDLKKDTQYQAQQGQQFSDQRFNGNGPSQRFSSPGPRYTEYHGRLEGQGQQFSSQSPNDNNQGTSKFQARTYDQQRGAELSNSNCVPGTPSWNICSAYLQLQPRAQSEQYNNQKDSSSQNENFPCFFDGNTVSCPPVGQNGDMVQGGSATGNGYRANLVFNTNDMAVNLKSAISAVVEKKDQIRHYNQFTQEQLHRALHSFNQALNEFTDSFLNWAPAPQKSQAVSMKEQVINTLRNALNSFGNGGF